MSEKYKVRNSQALYFITSTIVDWVDVFTRPVYKDIIINSWKYCQKEKGLNVHAYVIMTNHFHAIMSSDKVPLNDIVRDMKKFTSRELIKAIGHYRESRRVWLLKKFRFAAERIKRGAEYKVWQDNFHPIELDTYEMALQKMEYIHQNPVKELIVLEPHHYFYSSAGFYADMDNGLIDIEPLY